MSSVVNLFSVEHLRVSSLPAPFLSFFLLSLLCGLSELLFNCEGRNVLPYYIINSSIRY